MTCRVSKHDVSCNEGAKKGDKGDMSPIIQLHERVRACARAKLGEVIQNTLDRIWAGILFVLEAFIHHQ